VVTEVLAKPPRPEVQVEVEEVLVQLGPAALEHQEKETMEVLD
jgi:hypothetical protein